jgi:hypothetical protein
MPGREASPDRAIAEERAVRDAEAEVYDEHVALKGTSAAINTSLRLLLELGGAHRARQTHRPLKLLGSRRRVRWHDCARGR